MKLTSYTISAFIFFIALNNFADNPPPQVIISFPEPAKKEEPAPAPSGEEPIKLPEDIRNQLRVNVLNQSGKTLGFFAKIKAATQQDASVIQPWEYLEVFTRIKESATVATFHGNPKAKYEHEESLVSLLEKDDEGEDEWVPLDCKLAPSALGQVASKRITFIVGKEPGEDLMSCLIYYDK